jgi:GDP-L-fucose synthase
MNKDEVILVTGAAGVVGKTLCAFLKDSGYRHVIGISRKDADLRDYNAVNKVYSQIKPDYVFMIAAKVGGIPSAIKHQADYLSDNLKMELNLFELSHKYKVKKNLFMGSSALYPMDSPNPKNEDMFLTGLLDNTKVGYVHAKIAGIKLAELYFSQFGMLTICPMVANIFGDGHSFDLNRSHVAAALVKNIADAKESGIETIQLRGTGNARREFIHVDDVVRGLHLLMNNYKSSKIINLGSGYVISIKELANMIAAKIGYTGEITWDITQNDGIPERYLDNNRISQLGFSCNTDIDTGISRTINEYLILKNDRSA